MIIASSILLAVAAVYAFLVLRCSVALCRASKHVPGGSIPPSDIIVAAKNEQHNIAKLADSIMSQDHPDCRLILVDDHSDDATPAIARERLAAPHLIVESQGRGKKEALKSGISHSKAQYILLTDADCFPQPQWARLMTSAAFDTGAEMVMAPIIIEPKDRSSLFQRLQMAESFALITITAGTCLNGMPVMCNGGNIAYRADFLKSNTAGMNKGYASGDDMFMMETASRQGRRFAYVCNQEAAIRTYCVESWGQLLNQRARWVSKTGGYSSKYILFFAFSILLGNLAMIAAPIMLLLNLLPLWALAAVALVKFVPDYFSVKVSSDRYGEHQRLLDVIIMEAVYPYYVAASCVSSLLRGFKWK